MMAETMDPYALSELSVKISVLYWRPILKQMLRVGLSKKMMMD